MNIQIEKNITPTKINIKCILFLTLIKQSKPSAANIAKEKSVKNKSRVGCMVDNKGRCNI